MSITQLDGAKFKQLMQYGYDNLKQNAKVVDELNVFPIPDGDTGENMSYTLYGGIQAMNSCDAKSAGQLAKKLADGMTMSARGNSGVILSQLFYGAAKEIQNYDVLTIQQLCYSLQKGVKTAYASVLEPVEGTMLTVARECTEYANEIAQCEMEFHDFFDKIVQRANESVRDTPEKLPVLKEAGVVDSGGAGLYYIVEGFEKCVKGQSVQFESEVAATVVEDDYGKFNADSVLEFGYCTEVLLQLQRCKVDVDNFDVSVIKDYLSTIGDSIVVFASNSVVKVHVHTFTPYKVLEFCQKYGEFLKIKIENMTLQHNEATVRNRFEIKAEKRKERKKYGLVTVATGEGLIQTFKDFGADVVIEGGQTNNPSIEDFVDAFNQTNADEIFVLPNNSNVILAARQAANMYEGSVVHVVESKSIGDGYAAMSMLDYSLDDAQEIISTMQEEIKGTTTGAVTVSIRAANCNGISIHKEDYIGFCGKQMLVADQSRLNAVCSLIDKLDDGSKSILLLIYGNDPDDKEKELVKAYASQKHSNLELYEIEGKQNIYSYYVILQ